MNAKEPTPGIEEIELRVGETTAIRISIWTGELGGVKTVDAVEVFSSDGLCSSKMAFTPGVTLDMVRTFATELLVVTDGEAPLRTRVLALIERTGNAPIYERVADIYELRALLGIISKETEYL